MDYEFGYEGSLMNYNSIITPVSLHPATYLYRSLGDEWRSIVTKLLVEVGLKNIKAANCLFNSRIQQRVFQGTLCLPIGHHCAIQVYVYKERP
jgi:hypothetical protein